VKSSKTSSELFRLKFRFQFALLWLPIIVGIALMVAGGYALGNELAPHFGIDPNASLSAQAHGGGYFWTLMCLLIVLLIVGAVATYFLVGLLIGLALRDSKIIWAILKGRYYPDGWYA